MPYARTMRTRSYSRTRSRASRPKYIRVNEKISVSFVGASGGVVLGSAPSTVSAMRQQLGITDSTGYTLVRAFGQVCAYPQNAPAAGTRDDLTIVLISTDSATPLASIDPTANFFSAPGFVPAYRPLWTGMIMQPLTAASVGTNWMIPTQQRIISRRRVRLMDLSDDIKLVAGSGVAGLSWHIDGWMSTIWQLP